MANPTIKIDSGRIKQIIYGGIFILIIFSLLIGVYFIWFRLAPTCFDGKENSDETGVDCGGPCQDCAIKFLAPLQTSWIKYFASQDGTVVVAEIKNFNIAYGANSLYYTVSVYGGTGNLVGTLKKNSFIYDGEIKYLIEPINVNSRDIKDIKISFSGIKWISNKKFARPTMQLREIKTESVNPDNPGEGIVVSGYITNKNSYDLSKVRVMGFLFKQSGVQLTASKTEMEKFGAYEEKFFKINFPKNLSLVMDQAQIAPASATSSGDNSDISTLPSAPTFNYKFTQDLELGSKGKDVEELQQFLKNQGFFESEINGVFDSATRQSLIKYQRAIGVVSITGRLDTETRDFINSFKPTPTGGGTPPTSYKINLFEVDPTKTRIYVEAIH